MLRVLGICVMGMSAALAACVAASAQQQPPTVTRPSASSAQATPRRTSSPYGSAAAAQTNMKVAAGTIAGYVYWDMSAAQYKLSSPCQGLTVNVSTIGKPQAGGGQVVATTSNFAPMGPMTDLSAQGAPKYMLCSYSFHQMPVGEYLRVTAAVNVAAFSKALSVQNPPDFEIFGGNCNNTPQSTLSFILTGGEMVCGNSAYNINLKLYGSGSQSRGTLPVGSGPLLQSASGTSTPPGGTLKLDGGAGGGTTSGGTLLQVPGGSRAVNSQPLPPRTTANAGAGNPGSEVAPNRQPSTAGKAGSSTVNALQPLRLAPPKALRKATNPLLSRQDASINAVLQQQNAAAKREAEAMKLGLKPASAAVSRSSRESVPARGLGPEKTQSAPANTNSSIAHAPAFDSVVLTCTNDPSARILRVNGGQAPRIFTPEARYNLYTIVGCGFGMSQSGSTSYIFGANGFKANLNIDFWSDNAITAHLDPWLAGVLDQNNVTLVVSPAGRQELQKPGFKFYAARGMPAPDGSDQEVPLAFSSIPQSSVALYNVSNFLAGFDQLPSNATSKFASFSFQGTPVGGWVFRYAYEHNDRIAALRSADCYINDAAFNGDPCQQFVPIGSRYSPGQWQLKSDTWDFNKLVPGFQISSYQLYVSTLDPSTLCGAATDMSKEAYLDGDWSFNLNAQNQIVVTWPVYRCRDVEFGTRDNMMIQSAYGLAVSVIGPRCVDPWTGQKDQACMNKVKQIPS